MPRRYRYGAVEVRPAERMLSIAGERMELGGRAFDVLMALIENRGRVVTKDELLADVWPGLVVEENNLQQQISALRKLMGQDAILTVPGRGYQFALEETPPAAQADSAPPTAAPGSSDATNTMPSRWRGRRALLIAGAGALLALAGALAWWNANRPANAPAAPLSIAVLPFANLTGDPNQGYMADGLTAALTHDLSRIREARIVDASMAYAFKDKPVLAQEAGAELGVRYVLVGSVQRSNGRIRFHAQLDDTASGEQLWSDNFDGDETDLFALEDRVTARIVNSVDREMVVAAARESEKRISDPKVADLLLRAWALNLSGDSTGRLLQMEDLYRQALAIEPDNAVAMVGLANALGNEAAIFLSGPDGKTREMKFEESRALALKARDIDPGIPGIYVALQCYAKYHNDFAGYRHAAEARLALEPRNPVSYLNLAETYLDAAEPQRAIELINRATDMDPKSHRYWPAADMAYSHFMLGENDAAIEWGLKAQEKNPNYPFSYAVLAMAYAQMGDQAKARAAVADLRRADPGFKLERLDRPQSSYPDSAKEFWDKKLVPAWRLAGLPE
jgi:adenylate cyclase